MVDQAREGEDDALVNQESGSIKIGEDQGRENGKKGKSSEREETSPSCCCWCSPSNTSRCKGQRSREDKGKYLPET